MISAAFWIINFVKIFVLYQLFQNSQPSKIETCHQTSVVVCTTGTNDLAVRQHFKISYLASLVVRAVVRRTVRPHAPNRS